MAFGLYASAAALTSITAKHNMKLKYFLYSGMLALAGFHVQLQPAAAAPVTFTIDPSRSSIVLSGNVVDASLSSTAFPFTAQGAGSLTTKYTGTILVDLAPPNIQFPGGSTITAETNGTWKPAVGGGTTSTPGSAPADYGGEINQFLVVTAYFAARNLQFDATSSAAALTNGGFNSGLLTVTFLANSTPAPSVDYNVVVPLSPSSDTTGTETLVGSATNITATAYLTNAFNVTNVAQKLTLNIPVNITNVSTVSGDVITVILTGTVVATAPAAAWPAPQVNYSFQAGQLTLTWYSIPGQSFTVQTTQNLRAAWTTAPGPLATNANTTSWTGNTTNTAQFFRVNAIY